MGLTRRPEFDRHDHLTFGRFDQHQLDYRGSARHRCPLRAYGSTFTEAKVHFVPDMKDYLGQK